MAFSLTFHQAPAALRPYIGVFYVFRAHAAVEDLPLGALMAQLNWVLAGDFAWSIDGCRRAAGAETAVGATMVAPRVTAAPGTVLVGAGVLPAGWAQLLRAPAFELTNASASTRDVLERRLVRTEDINPFVDDASLAAAVALRLQPLYTEATGVDPREALITAWLVNRDDPRDRLHSRLGLSERQVERLAKSIFGAPPHSLAAKYRALRIGARLALEPGLAWDEAGGDRYADQSHFIRDFRRFLGTTPTVYTNASTLALDVLRRRWRAGSHHPLAVLG